MAPTPYNTSADQDQFEILNAKLVEVHQLAATRDQAIVEYTDRELSALQDKFNVLDPDGVVNAISRINAFLQENDADGNNKIDKFEQLIVDLGALTSRVEVLENDNSTNKAAIAGLQQVQGQQAQLLSGLRGDVDQHSQQIAELLAREDDAGLTEEQVRAIAVEQDRGLLGAFGASLSSVAFASVDLGFTYPITGAPAGGTGGIA